MLVTSVQGPAGELPRVGTGLGVAPALEEPAEGAQLGPATWHVPGGDDDVRLVALSPGILHDDGVMRQVGVHGGDVTGARGGEALRERAAIPSLLLDDDTGVQPFRDDRNVIPSHPHNGALQIMVETGLVGSLLVLGLLILLSRRIDGLPPAQRAPAVAMLVTVLGVAATAYGIWQSHWLAMIGAAVVVFVAVQPSDQR